MEKTQNQAPKKCPFCGSDAVLRARLNTGRQTWDVYVGCKSCETRGPAHYAKENPEKSEWKNSDCLVAIRAWNYGVRDEVEKRQLGQHSTTGLLTTEKEAHKHIAYGSPRERQKDRIRFLTASENMQ